MNEDSVADEIWKDIPGYEGLYKVSSIGRVFSYPREHCKAKILKPTIAKRGGYYTVVIYKGSMRKRVPIHRLVALAFIPNPDNKPCIDHIDTNRHNNSVENLKWCTYKENRHNPITYEKQRQAIIRYKRRLKNGLRRKHST